MSTIAWIVCGVVAITTIFILIGASSPSPALKPVPSEVINKTTLTATDEVVCDEFASLALKIEKGIVNDGEARQELINIYDKGGSVASPSIQKANEDMISYLTSHDESKARSYADFIVACNLEK